MTLKFQLQDNLDEVGVLFGKDTRTMIVRSVRRSIRLASKRLRADAVDTIREKYAFKSNKETKDFLRERVMLKGSNINRFIYELRTRRRKPQLIRFVRGNKSPRKQKGVKVARRRALSIEITPGNRRKDKSLFIALNKGNPIVLRRRTNKRPRGSGELIDQRAPQVSRAFTQAKRNWIARRAIKRMNEAFVHDMRFRLGQASKAPKLKVRRAA